MEVVAERPLFIPPKKRQTGRKTIGTVSHSDHIMTVQGKNYDLPSPRYSDTSPTDAKINSSNTYTSIADRPKLELPIDEEIYSVDTDIDSKTDEQKSTYHLNHSREIIDLSPIFENVSESTEIIKMDVMTQGNLKMQSLDSNTTYSLSNTQSDNSLDMHDSLNSTRSKKSKKRVNIQTGSTEPLEPCKPDSVNSGSLERSMSGSNYLTMTGTIKRGKKKGQNIDVQLNISAEQLEMLEATIVAKELNKSRNICICNLKSGLHIFLWSLICLPFVTLISSVYSFYMGTLTWYNVFTYFSEEKSCLHKLFLSPILVILYPFVIVLCTLGLGLYAGFVQVSICGVTWWKEVADIEKGFYGWLCSFFKISDCSPYEVVILTDLRDVNGRSQPSVEEISM